MTPARERAMAALREWAAPGARAQLIAAAWRAGEHNVAALAEAADVSRPTVYADLASVGIDPRTDRTERPVIGTITLGPFTGTETLAQVDAVHRAHLATMPRSGTPLEQEAHVHAGGVLLDQEYLARYHNGLVADAQAEAEAREAAQQALHRVEVTWAALSTARAWHAAHHAYVVAVDDARRTVAAWLAAARATAATRDELVGYGARGAEPAKYRQYVPEDQQITVDPDAPAAAAAALEETYERRRALVRETLGLPADLPATTV
jgi:hypothetical protein